MVTAWGGDGYYLNGDNYNTGQTGAPYSSGRRGATVQYRVPVPNGTYAVTLYVGTNAAQNQANSVEGTSLTLIVAANQTATQAFTASVSDGFLDIIATDLPGGTATATLSGIEITPTTGQVFTDRAYPFAIKYYRGAVYVGTTCASELSQNRSMLQSIVYRLPDDGTSTFTSVLTVPLLYKKGRTLYSGSDVINGVIGQQWNPWSTAPYTFDQGSNVYPQPVLSDIEFDVDGSMILGYFDRLGMQHGNLNFPPAGGAANENAIGSGDILRADNASGTFVLENNGQAGTVTGGVGNGQGPGGGEFYRGDVFQVPGTSAGHEEISLGGLALLPGRNEVALTIFDPFAINTGGVA